ncbi:hypothetical protein PG993_006973 [Apiospora rasikravindrae]|uniref:Uncharacterized protein n=1 Tax=Apiospora rasikravindrae TaxID=990691 RepID=A0ABR1SW67_9PEZI
MWDLLGMLPLNRQGLEDSRVLFPSLAPVLVRKPAGPTIWMQRLKNSYGTLARIRGLSPLERIIISGRKFATPPHDRQPCNVPSRYKNLSLREGQEKLSQRALTSLLTLQHDDGSYQSRGASTIHVKGVQIWAQEAHVVTPRMREGGVRRDGVDKIPSQAKAAIGLALQKTHGGAWSSLQAWRQESGCLMGKAQPSNRTDGGVNLGKIRQLFSRRKGDKGGAPDGPPGPSVASASARSSTPSRAFPSGIKLLHCPSDCTVDVVFVHGLTGDREKTWTAHNESEPWPQTLLPSRLPTARVLTFGYDASVADWKGMVSQSRIANHAGNLLSSLAAYRDDDGTDSAHYWARIGDCETAAGHKPPKYTSLHTQVYLPRDPHHGAGLTRWAEQLARSVVLVKQTNSDTGDVIKQESEF